MKNHLGKIRKLKIHHLIRYFVVLGLIASIGYANHWQDKIFLLLVGPILYLSAPLQNLIEKFVGPMNHSIVVNLYGIVMPITILYYGIIGFQLKQLWNEQGFVRLMSMFAMIGFILFVHYLSWTHLNGYFALPT